MKSFEVVITRRDDVQNVHVAGEVDLETSPRLWQQLQSASQAGVGIRVDLSDVDYIDSSGIAVLVQGLKLAGKRSIDYRLVEPSARVMAVLELAQLQRLFNIERSEPGS